MLDNLGPYYLTAATKRVLKLVRGWRFTAWSKRNQTPTSLKCLTQPFNEIPNSGDHCEVIL